MTKTLTVAYGGQTATFIVDDQDDAAVTDDFLRHAEVFVGPGDYPYGYDVQTIIRWGDPGAKWAIVHHAVLGHLAVYGPRRAQGEDFYTTQNLDRSLTPVQVSQAAEQLRNEVQQRIDDGQL